MFIIFLLKPPVVENASFCISTWYTRISIYGHLISSLFELLNVKIRTKTISAEKAINIKLKHEER